MKKVLKYSYYLISFIFLLCTIFEVIEYLKINSNLYGLIYLFFNYFILFVLFTIVYNFSDRNKKVRISKNIMIIVLGLFASFILALLVPALIHEVDSSFVFASSVFLVSKVIKPILYFCLIILSIIELKFKKIS
ncbi:MAG: hypothetical protein RSB41_02550 [Bacilli bacterium]